MKEGNVTMDSLANLSYGSNVLNEHTHAVVEKNAQGYSIFIRYATTEEVAQYCACKGMR